jgi:CxxC-x17-CxxC domain-containing protein
MLMPFKNKDLICRDCQKTFVFSEGEQEFFSAKGLINEPKRCANCRILMRVQRNGEDPKQTAEVNCAECALPTRVPFQPKGYRPVYCSACFRSKKLSLEIEPVNKEIQQIASI